MVVIEVVHIMCLELLHCAGSAFVADRVSRMLCHPEGALCGRLEFAETKRVPC